MAANGANVVEIIMGWRARISFTTYVVDHFQVNNMEYNGIPAAPHMFVESL